MTEEDREQTPAEAAATDQQDGGEVQPHAAPTEAVAEADHGLTPLDAEAAAAGPAETAHQDHDHHAQDQAGAGAAVAPETSNIKEAVAGSASAENGVELVKESPLLTEDVQSIQDPEAGEQSLKYPKVVFFIIGNEFCERFSYYGMRTILSLFLVNALRMTEENSTVIYHVFTMLCYFFPVLGAIIADSWLGKFNTIAYLSIVYAVGNIVVSFASVTSINIPSLELTFLGLLLISIGTGGIKPCVSAFGGDQFVVPQQQRQLAAFFSVFYFSINAGSLISTYLTPELRTIACLGQETCYPLAFGVPAVLMFVSLIIFVIGKPGYKIIKPKGNVLVQVSRCMWNAWTNKIKSKEKKEHWLEYADARFDDKLRSDIRAMLRVVLLFVPLPVFWALFDQQGSRWTFQANNMNGRIGSWVVKPDQMQVVNPLLILLFLPLCEAVVYPLLNKVGLLTRPLQKMAAGGVLAAAAFIISGVLELQLEKTYPVSLSPGFAQVRVFNALPCDVTLSGGADFANGSATLEHFGLWSATDIAATKNKTYELNIAGDCLSESQLSLSLEEEKSFSFVLYLDSAKTLQYPRLEVDNLEKDASPRIRVWYYFTDGQSHNLKFSKDSSKDLSRGPNSYIVTPALDPAEYTVLLDDKSYGEKQFYDVGGVYTVLVGDKEVKSHTVIQPNVINLFWLIPQYVVITLAEVMFSVTGLEFAFTQAPVSMKSVLTSAWLLTVAFGNLIVVLITESRFFDSQASEFFLFAGLMLGVMIIFVWLAMRYKYVETESAEDEVAGGEQPLNFVGSNGVSDKDSKDHKS